LGYGRVQLAGVCVRTVVTGGAGFIGSLVENIDYWRQAPVWTPESIEVATRDWLRYLGKE
jgi:dTDP-D-glucose 4,6-dehydratase